MHDDNKLYGAISPVEVTECFDAQSIRYPKIKLFSKKL